MNHERIASEAADNVKALDLRVVFTKFQQPSRRVERYSGNIRHTDNIADRKAGYGSGDVRSVCQ
jgi:hypothetical protein